MVTPELQNKIDEHWNACWPMNQLRPIVILDLVSYLFFVKKISSLQQFEKEPGNKSNSFFTGSNGRQEIAGDFFNDPEDLNIRSIFTSENGIVELDKEYSQHSEYGAFFKDGLLMAPTPKLLDTALGIIKIIEVADGSSKGAIFDYLLNKTDLIAPDGHAYLPECLVELLVAIINPEDRDFILNPSLGNGSLLVGCAKYIAGKNPGLLNRNIDNVDPQKLKGFESDVTSLRIGAMNLLMHGINNPALKKLDIFSPLNSVSAEGANVLITNLIFSPGENNRNVEAGVGGEAIRKELYYLDFILKNTSVGARCVVLVPDIFLYQIAPEFITIRTDLIENFKLDAVITVDDKSFAEFNGAGILVFSKEVSAVTDMVWFYKLKYNKPAMIAGPGSYCTDNILKQNGGIQDILDHIRNKEKNSERGSGFYIHADELRAKNYNFSYGEYCLFAKEESPTASIITVQSVDFPKWKPQNGNKTTSLLRPIPERALANKSLTEPGQTVRTEAFSNFYRKAIYSKKASSKKNIYITGALILIICIGYLFYWLLANNNDSVVQRKLPVGAKMNSDSTKSPAAVNSSSLRAIDSVVNEINNDISENKGRANREDYTVISKAYFYSSPSVADPQPIYITNVMNDTLTLLKEENGFVYVDYINRRGENRKGWLDKNDLELTHSSNMADEINKKANEGLENVAEDGATKYVIKAKAYFYRAPDSNTRRDLYLSRPNHTILSPSKEENGFLYVVYTNTRGQTTTGWLNKKDLEVVGK